MDITNAIREVDKNHIVFIEANCWANNYKGIFPLWDKNIVVSFHKYWNYNSDSSIQNFIQIREQQNVPLWLGESGENSNVWFRDAIELLERNKIGWAWWPLKKLGYNNPLQVKQNKGYDQLLNYWKGKGAKPSSVEAFNALMQLTEDIKAENNIFHKDVIDAMFRQTKTNGTVPFKPHAINHNTIVYATDFDLGRNGYAYLDKDTGNYWVSTGTRTAGNKGSMYRNDGVDIASCNDATTNGYSVSSTEAGEWLQYTINTSSKGKYDVELRTLSKDSVGKIELIVNGKVVGKEVTIPSSANAWANTLLKNISINKGFNTFRLHILKGGFDINYYRFLKPSEGGQKSKDDRLTK